MVENCGMPEEKIYRDVEEIPMNHSVSIGDAQYEKWTKELEDELRALEG